MHCNVDLGQRPMWIICMKQENGRNAGVWTIWAKARVQVSAAETPPGSRTSPPGHNFVDS